MWGLNNKGYVTVSHFFCPTSCPPLHLQKKHFSWFLICWKNVKILYWWMYSECIPTCGTMWSRTHSTVKLLLSMSKPYCICKQWQLSICMEFHLHILGALHLLTLLSSSRKKWGKKISVKEFQPSYDLGYRHAVFLQFSVQSAGI